MPEETFNAKRGGVGVKILIWHTGKVLGISDFHGG